MDLSSELLFFFSAIGVFNGLVFAGYYLFVKRPALPVYRLFGAFLLAVSLRVGKSVFLYFYRDLAYEYLQIGLTGCLLIGPLLYLFVRAANGDDAATVRRRLRLHVAPLLTLALVGGTLYSYRAHPEVWQRVVVWLIYAVWGGYTLAAARVGRAYFRRSLDREAVLPGDRWMASVIGGTFLVFLCYATVSFTSYITGALAFTFVLYATWAAGQLPVAPKKPRSPTLAPDDEQRLLQRLEDVMTTERPYLDPNLKLADLAAAINATPHQLSHLLNNVIGERFHHYLNTRRVAHARELIRTEEHLTLEAIGLACGFNSRSTFYKAFKKTTGSTPAAFRNAQPVND